MLKMIHVQECARYLETYKVYETKSADSILGRTDEDYLSRLNAAFTTVRGVNKTDVLTLATTFKTAKGMMQASIEELSACPGIGPTKVNCLISPENSRYMPRSCETCLDIMIKHEDIATLYHSYHFVFCYICKK